MNKILIIGSSCSGKSTLSRLLGERLGIIPTELDELFWNANWVEVEKDIFRQRVQNVLMRDQWILDGNYTSKIQDLVWDKADTIIWTDPPLPLILKRFFHRSISRALKKEVLWNGCQETLRNSIFSRNSLLIWILKTHKKRRDMYRQLLLDFSAKGRQVYHIRNPKELNSILNLSIHLDKN